MSKSPYLEYKLRLQDVIAAIQFMGAHDFENLDLNMWTEKLGPPISLESGTWKEVFKDHPEFFHVEENVERNNELYYSLQWRRAYNRDYDPTQNRKLTAAQIDALSADQKNT